MRADLTSPVGFAGIVPITLTAFEIARLVALMTPRIPEAERIRRGLHWSWWRRCHQALARACHRRRNQARASESTAARPPPIPPRTTASTPIYD
ncbi:hypothetical protein V1460_12725 [Streptomyces sp. SCSIO 30461]|uniref:hypothetical protein n=1 Tax=Streptomyces sp. SCSIO 30461 TaxID=3118085 RepID=UPI0030CD7039